jgi:predicted NBD/HSP70 family sugar kinase
MRVESRRTLEIALRRIDPADFRVARRGTSRAINRQIALTLIRTHQPISRADLARMMGFPRGSIGLLVNELIDEGMIVEGAKGEARRGRKPQFLHIESRGRCVVAVDVRATRTFVMAADILGRPLTGITSFATPREPARLIRQLAQRIKATLREHREIGKCHGIGVVVPGMVDHRTRRVLRAPTLGWEDVALREGLAAATGHAVYVENSGKACVLSQMWTGAADTKGDLVFVNISDGVGVGALVNGELLRGWHNVGGEYGHVPLNIEGPRCSCGGQGCWEAYVSNLATVSRYLGRPAATPAAKGATELTVDDVIARARRGDARAVSTLQVTARYLGLGLGAIANTVDPERLFLSGEVTAAWDMLESAVRAGLAEVALTAKRAQTDLVIVPVQDYPRLRGAATLVVMPAFAAPSVA